MLRNLTINKLYEKNSHNNWFFVKITPGKRVGKTLINDKISQVDFV